MYGLYESAKRYVNRMAKTSGCPRCGAPLTEGGNCSQSCGGI
jgi:hypothetical protein